MSLRAREDKARRQLKKQGQLLRKSRVQTVNGDNFGGYMIIDAQCNSILAGAKYDLEIEDVERWANEGDVPES